jgi:hypothetical protein
MLGKYWPANLRLPLDVVAAMDRSPKYGKGYLEFTTGDELLELLDYCDAASLISSKSEPSVPVVDEKPKPAASNPGPARGPVVINNRK